MWPNIILIKKGNFIVLKTRFDRVNFSLEIQINNKNDQILFFNRSISKYLNNEEKKKDTDFNNFNIFKSILQMDF